MLLRKCMVSGISAVLTASAPVIALADGGNEAKDGDPTVTAILALSIALGLIAVGVLHQLPNYRLNTLQLSVAGLGTITTAIHLLLGLSGDMLLLVNALGYALLLAILFVPIGPRSERRTLMLITSLCIYSPVTFVGYFATHSYDHFSTLGVFSKIVEFALMLVLVIWFLQARSREAVVAGQ